MKTEERFWAKVRRSSVCWEWQGARDRDGYGVFRTLECRGETWKHVKEVRHV